MCHMLPPSCCLSATGVRFLGVLFPPRNSASLTVGLPPTSNVMDLTGSPRSTRMRHDRVGCQLYPGSGGVPTTVEPSSVAARRFSTARSSSSPPPRPDPGSCRNEASPLVHARSPLRASHPAITSRARQRRGPIQDTDRSHVFDIEVEPPIDETTQNVRHRVAPDRGRCVRLRGRRHVMGTPNLDVSTTMSARLRAPENPPTASWNPTPTQPRWP